MPENNKNEFENQINDAVQKAINNQDYAQIKEMLGATVQTVVEKTAYYGGQIGQNISQAISDAQKNQAAKGPGAYNYARGQNGQPVYSRYSTQWQKPGNVKAKPFKQKNIPAPGSGVAPIVIGSVFTAFFGSRLIGYINELYMTGFAGFSFWGFAWRAGMVALFANMIVEGAKSFKKRRFRQYYNAVAGRPVVNLNVLAMAAGKTVAYVRKDIKKMIAKGMFGTAYLDDDENCLIVGEEVYRQYRLGQANRKASEMKEQKIKQDPSGIDAVVAEGAAWVQKIQAANSALPEIEISKKLTDLENITVRIFAYVEKRPEKLPEIQKFMSYYLPTTVKLVGSYQELDAQPLQGENILTAKKEILEILDTVNYAFASLFDSLFGDDAIDISTDIAVLKNMLAREGLTEPAFRLPTENTNEMKEG